MKPSNAVPPHRLTLGDVLTWRPFIVLRAFFLMFALASVLSPLFLTTGWALGQAVPRDTPPYPPEAADKSITRDEQQQPPALKPHIDRVQIEREARELSDLAKTLPTDIDHVNRGLLPKDVLDKLKRIEKLAKHLRGELTP
jgi:hypothetical protein